jgi:hypothetical protein
VVGGKQEEALLKDEKATLALHSPVTCLIRKASCSGRGTSSAGSV